MHERFNEALKVALKSQDKVRISTLRLINAAIKDRDIADRTDNGVRVCRKTSFWKSWQK